MPELDWTGLRRPCPIEIGVCFDEPPDLSHIRHGHYRSAVELVIAIGAAFIAAAAAIFTGLQWAASHRAANAAEDAVAKADEANRIAQEANDIARESEARATERHDVTWDGEWDGRRYTLTNTGEDTAFAVRSRVIIDGEEAQATSDALAPGEHLEMELPDLARRTADVRRRAAQAATSRVGPDAWGLPEAVPCYEYAIWQSEKGAQHTHEAKGLMSLE